MIRAERGLIHWQRCYMDLWKLKESIEDCSTLNDVLRRQRVLDRAVRATTRGDSNALLVWWRRFGPAYGDVLEIRRRFGRLMAEGDGR